MESQPEGKSLGGNPRKDPIAQILARGRRRPCRNSQSPANPAHGAGTSCHRGRAIISGACHGARHWGDRHAAAGHQRCCHIGSQCLRSGRVSRILRHASARHQGRGHVGGRIRVSRIIHAGMPAVVVPATYFSCRSRAASHQRNARYGDGQQYVRAFRSSRRHSSTNSRNLISAHQSSGTPCAASQMRSTSVRAQHGWGQAIDKRTHSICRLRSCALEAFDRRRSCWQGLESTRAHGAASASPSSASILEAIPCPVVA